MKLENLPLGQLPLAHSPEYELSQSESKQAIFDPSVKTGTRWRILAPLITLETETSKKSHLREERQQESVGAGRKGQERGGRGPGQGKVAEGLPVVTYGCRPRQKQGAGALVGAMGAVAPWEESLPLARETTPTSSHSSQATPRPPSGNG